MRRKVPRPVDSAVIKIKYQNDEAGKDDPDVDNEVEESRETLDQSSCELFTLRCPQKGIWIFFLQLDLEQRMV